MENEGEAARPRRWKSEGSTGRRGERERESRFKKSENEAVPRGQEGKKERMERVKSGNDVKRGRRGKENSASGKCGNLRTEEPG